VDESSDSVIRASMTPCSAALVHDHPWPESTEDPLGCEPGNDGQAEGRRNVVLHAVTPCDDAPRLVSTQIPRLAVLFGPRRGVTRDVHQKVLVGRAVEADLQLIDEKVSREHCVFEPQGTSVVVRDLGSRNGTWVNGERLHGPHVLAANDTVGIGETLVVYSPDVEALLARDGDSTLIMSGATALGLTTSAAEVPGADAWAQAGKLMLESALAPSREEAAQKLARAVLAGMHCDQVLLCTRTAEGALRPWVGLPAGLVMAINPALAELAVKQQRAVSVEESQPRALRDEVTTRVTNKRAFVLCAPLVAPAGTLGVVFAARSTPFDSKELALATVLATAVAPSLRATPVSSPVTRAELVAESASMKEAVRIARQVAPTTSTVLLTGESGTGKEELAALIHRSSKRAQGPFVALNCGAIPRELAESELFGHEKGAFTGATQQHAGVFERADGGTLFLDEIGELPLELQVKLLRVLEEKLVLRVGGRAPSTVDARIVCATNRELEREVTAGKFRGDLYWRLNVVRITLEPLRKRPEDVPALAARLLARHSASIGRLPPGVSAEALKVMAAYSWPGNVRQLANALERALVLKSDDSEVSLADLPPELFERASTSAADGKRTLGELIAALEREQIALAMKRARGVKAQAAEALGISRPTLDRKLEEYRIDWLAEPAS
jgi:transcriptional regulator with PAS, ATPase and Fis domain